MTLVLALIVTVSGPAFGGQAGSFTECRASNAALMRKAFDAKHPRFPQWVPASKLTGAFAGCIPLALFRPQADGYKAIKAYGLFNPSPVFSPKHILVGYMVPSVGFTAVAAATAIEAVPPELVEHPPVWEDFPR